jgi:hypothetical protein
MLWRQEITRVAPDCGYTVVTANSNVFFQYEDFNQLVDWHGGSTPTEEEQNIFIREQNEPLIVEWSHLSWNPKPLDTPRTVHDVGDLVGPYDSAGGSHQNCKVNYCSDNDGDVLNNMGRRNPHINMDGKQSTNMLMPHVDDIKSWCLEIALQDGGEQTFNLSNKNVHISSIQPAPDPVKPEPNLSPLGGEQTPTLVSKFAFDLVSDAVDRDSSVKRFPATIDLREAQQGIHGPVIPKLVEQKENLIKLMPFKILCEAPKYKCNNDTICTYNQIPNQIHNGNKSNIVIYVRILIPDYGEPPDQDFRSRYNINDIVELPSPRNTPSIPIKVVPKTTILYVNVYDNMFDSPSITGVLSLTRQAAVDSNSKHATMLRYNTATVRDSTATHSLPKQHYDASAYNYVRKFIASMIVGSHLVNETVNTANKVGKQWKHCKIWKHLKTHIFYSGDPGDLNKPAEKGEKR